MESTSSSSNLFELQIDHQSSAYLSQAAKWAKFLAIVGFIFCGIFLLFSFFASAVMGLFMRGFGGGMGATTINPSGVSSAFFFVMALIPAVIYFFPCLYLFRFATKMQLALKGNDQSLLTNSFGNLKSFYKFIGILMIIGLCFFALEIVLLVVFAAASLR